MKFVIAGLGSIGRRHLRNLVALGERDVILYRTHHSTLTDEDLVGFSVETELEAALSHKPDAVIISNPTSLHLDVAIPAARAGAHLLLEKPISHNMERVVELEEAIVEGGGRILVGFQFRFHPGLVKTAELIKQGAIGRPLSSRAVYGEYLPGMHPWEDYRNSYSARKELGGGVILTLCHPLDYMRWLLGEVSELWAFVRRLNDFEIQVEDTVEIGLQFESGAVGSLNLNYNQIPRSQHIEIIGVNGTLRWENDTGAVSFSRAQDSISWGDGSGDWKTYGVPDNFDRNDMFLAEMKHFLEVMKGEAQPVCSLNDGRKALELALAAHESGRNGQLIKLSHQAFKA
jgi:predicted dehydrogenase